MRGTSSCNNKEFISADELETIVQLQLVSRANYKLKHFKPSKRADNSLKIEAQKQIEELKSQIDNLIDNIGKGNAITDKLFTERITSLDNKINELKSELNTSNNEPDIDTLKLICNDIKNRFNFMPIDEKNKVAKLLIEKVTVNSEDNIKVFFKP